MSVFVLPIKCKKKIIQLKVIGSFKLLLQHLTTNKNVKAPICEIYHKLEMNKSAWII